jgi:hypothetical protein
MGMKLVTFIITTLYLNYFHITHMDLTLPSQFEHVMS